MITATLTVLAGPPAAAETDAAAPRSVTLQVLHSRQCLDSTKAFRCDPDGDVVWRREGGLLDVTNELLDLPLPGERLVIAPPQRPWGP